MFLAFQKLRHLVRLYPLQGTNRGLKLSVRCAAPVTCFPELGPVQAGKFQFRIGLGTEIEDEASKFSEAQIAFVLRQAEEGTAIGEVCRKAGISEATFYNWRKKYAGLLPSEMKRLKQLEEENGKLKKLVADLSLDKAMLQDVLSKKL